MFLLRPPSLRRAITLAKKWVVTIHRGGGLHLGGRRHPAPGGCRRSPRASVLGQPQGWVDVAGRRKVGAGPPSAKRPCWSGLRSRAWRDDEQAERRGKVPRASGAIAADAARTHITAHRHCDAVMPACGASASRAPPGVRRRGVTGLRPSCPPPRRFRAAEDRGK